MRPTPKKEKAMRRLLIRIAFILAPYNDFLRFDERISRRAWNIRNFAYFCSSNDKSRASKQAVGGKNGGKRFSAHQFFERKTLENRRQDPLSPQGTLRKVAKNPVNHAFTGFLFLAKVLKKASESRLSVAYSVYLFSARKKVHRIARNRLVCTYLQRYSS